MRAGSSRLTFLTIFSPFLSFSVTAGGAGSSAATAPSAGSVAALAGGSSGTASSVSVGAGAGGSILIRAGTLRGSGRISAAGGGNGRDVWNSYGGSGGGGRVAVYYDALSLPVDSITARGGVAINVPGVGGSAGTVYLKANAQPYGSVIIDNGNKACELYSPLRTLLSQLKQLQVQAVE